MAQTVGRVNDSDTVSLEPVSSAESFPWPPREGESALYAFVTTWKESVLHPTDFFRRMPREDNYGAVILYYMIIGVIAAGISLFWHSVLDLGGFTDAFMKVLGVKEPMPRSNGIMEFLFSPVLLLLGLYLGAGVTHLFLLLVRGAKHGFDTTTRVVAFAYGPALFRVVPILGALIGVVWVIVLSVIGLREAHETTTGRSVAAILLPYLVFGGIIFILTILAVVLGVLGSHV